MDDFIPVNDLDRAIMAMRKSQAGLPELCRQLLADELWVPLTYHPELEDGGAVPIQNGSPIPFALLDDGQGGLLVPIYSSDARLDESLKKCGVPENQFVAGAMPARQLLEVIGKQGFKAILNKGCATGNVTLGNALLRDLASGKALEPQPIHGGPDQRRQLTIVRPENYPTDFIQPVFEFLRQHPAFRVAFLFTDQPHATPAENPTYLFAVLMQPEDDVLFHDLNLVIGAGSRGRHQFELSPLDPADLATMHAAGIPFYAATDYRQPTPDKTAES